MYYKHSGRFSVGGVAIGLAVGAVSSFLLAAIYSVGIILIPEVHLAALATIAFGGLIGVATGYGLVWGKVRNARVTSTAAGILSCCALYVSWAMWVHNVLRMERVRTARWTTLAARPAALWDLITMINHYGTWGLAHGSPTTGWALWVIWSLEAVTVVGLGVLAAWGILHLRPFCETCGCWCGRAAKVLLAPPQDPGQLKRLMENNDLRALENLSPAVKGSDHLIVQLNSCKHCCQFHTLSVTYMMIRRNKLGQAHVSNTTLVKQLQIGPGEAEFVRQLSEKVKQTAKIGPPKANAAAAGK